MAPQLSTLPTTAPPSADELFRIEEERVRKLFDNPPIKIKPQPRRIVDVGHDGPSWHPARWVDLLLVAAFTLILWFGFAGKIAMDGFDSYFQFFTNWSWTLQVVYYTAKFFSFFDVTGRAPYWVNLALFWPTAITVSGVFVLVNIVRSYNPELFLDMIEYYGAGAVEEGDQAYHVLPLFVIIIDGWLSQKTLRYVLTRPSLSLFLFAVWQSMIAHAYIIFYMFFRDISVVYGLDPLWTLAMLSLYEAVAFVCILAMVLLSPLARSTTHHFFRETYHPNFHPFGSDSYVGPVGYDRWSRLPPPPTTTAALHAALDEHVAGSRALAPIHD